MGPAAALVALLLLAAAAPGLALVTNATGQIDETDVLVLWNEALPFSSLVVVSNSSINFTEVDQSPSMITLRANRRLRYTDTGIELRFGLDNSNWKNVSLLSPDPFSFIQGLTYDTDRDGFIDQIVVSTTHDTSCNSTSTVGINVTRGFVLENLVCNVSTTSFVVNVYPGSGPFGNNLLMWMNLTAPLRGTMIRENTGESLPTGSDASVQVMTGDTPFIVSAKGRIGGLTVTFVMPFDNVVYMDESYGQILSEAENPSIWILGQVYEVYCLVKNETRPGQFEYFICIFPPLNEAAFDPESGERVSIALSSWVDVTSSGPIGHTEPVNLTRDPGDGIEPLAVPDEIGLSFLPYVTRLRGIPGGSTVTARISKEVGNILLPLMGNASVNYSFIWSGPSNTTFHCMSRNESARPLVEFVLCVEPPLEASLFDANDSVARGGVRLSRYMTDGAGYFDGLERFAYLEDETPPVVGDDDDDNSTDPDPDPEPVPPGPSPTSNAVPLAGIIGFSVVGTGLCVLLWATRGRRPRARLVDAA